MTMRAMTTGTARGAAVAVVLATLWLLPPSAARAVDLTRYDSKYYTVFTDVDPAVAREAIARMTRMAEEYHERTKAFAGQIRRKFPFYLFKNESDYHAAGGMPGSAGVFIGSSDGSGKLMAFTGEHINPYTWHTVQHEGFHQFAHAVIGGDIPVWLNEGLAEYFGEGLFTGDGFVIGVVPPWRLQRVKAEIAGGRMKTIRAIMETSPLEWQAEMNIQNYDQAWSMVHFLVHGDDGRYVPAFSQCIRAISAGKPFESAWRSTIGTTDGFQDRWKAYWLGQPTSPTHALYQRATVATLTSFLARATADRQTFADLTAFESAADEGSLKMVPDDWLPPSLLAGAVKAAGFANGSAAPAEDAPADSPKPDVWELKPGLSHLPNLTLVTDDGTRLTGSYTLNGTHVSAVTVDIDDTAKVLADAAPLRDAGKKEQAKAMVQAALRAHPKSPLAENARAFLKGLW
jgi:hypothetical protein